MHQSASIIRKNACCTESQWQRNNIATGLLRVKTCLHDAMHMYYGNQCNVFGKSMDEYPKYTQTEHDARNLPQPHHGCLCRGPFFNNTPRMPSNSRHRGHDFVSICKKMNGVCEFAHSGKWFAQSAVELGAAIPKQAPLIAECANRIEVESRRQHGFFLLIRLGRDFGQGRGYE